MSSIANSNGGFTLFEFLIAMIILEIGLLAAIGVFQEITRSNTSVRGGTVATSIAQQELEDIRRKGFDRFTTAVSKTVDGRFYVQARATSVRRQASAPFHRVYSSPVRDTMTVKLSVTWGTPPRSVNMQTIMAK